MPRTGSASSRAGTSPGGEDPPLPVEAWYDDLPPRRWLPSTTTPRLVTNCSSPAAPARWRGSGSSRRGQGIWLWSGSWEGRMPSSTSDLCGRGSGLRPRVSERLAPLRQAELDHERRREAVAVGGHVAVREDIPRCPGEPAGSFDDPPDPCK